RRDGLGLRALHPAHRDSIGDDNLREMADKSVLDELVPAFVLGFVPLSLPAANVEPVARARHGDIEQAVVLLALGLLEASLGIGQRRKIGGARARPAERSRHAA